MAKLNPKPWLGFKISGICFAVTLAVYAALSVLKNNGTYLYFGGFDSSEILRVALGVLLVSLGLTVAFLLFSFKKIKVVAIVVSIILGVAISFFGVFGTLLSMAFAPDYDYYTVTSPDGQHEIIVKEESFLFGSWGDFYERTSRFTMQKLGEYHADDYLVMGHEMYKFEWQADGFEFEYYYGNGVYKTEVVKYAD